MSTEKLEMSSLRLQDAVLLTEQYPELSFGQVQQFISLASRLKNDILLTQPSSVMAFNPPDVLPPSVSRFLQNSCAISVDCVVACWNALNLTIWNDAHTLENSLFQDFAAHGHSLGLCVLSAIFEHSRDLQYNISVACTLYPPQHTCINANCSRSRTGMLLKKEEQRQAVLYTLDKGALPVCSVHLY